MIRARVRPAFSRFAGALRVGADFFARRGALVDRGPAPRGLVDRLTDLSNPGIDVTRVHPAIAAFFEDTSRLELLVRSEWRFPFSIGWLVFRWFMRLVGQFVLPAREGRIVTRVAALDTSRDGRADARAVIRTYAHDESVMQVVAYATWARADARYMSAAFPMPLGQIAGILRLDAIGVDDEGRLAVALTSARRGGDDAGVWFVIGPFSFRAPLEERLELWAPGMPGVPAELAGDALPGATIVGRHVQRLFGIRFVTHRYWFRDVGP